jgi:hypothetical protein
MNSQVESIIETARRFLGIKESPPNSNNVIFNTHYYGREVSGAAYPWCMTLIWDVFRLCNLSHLFYGGKKTASCAELLRYAKANNQLIESLRIERGDIVLYRFGRTGAAADHTGLVTSATPAGITAIEGNTSVGSDSDGGEVMERSRLYTNVVGAYRPKYEVEDEMTQDQFNEMMDKYLTARNARPESAWSVTEGAFAAAKKQGVMNGIAPQGFVTREEMAAVMKRTGNVK